MKRILVLFLSLILCLSMAVPAFAVDGLHPESTEVIDLGDGLVLVERVYEKTLARSNYKTFVREMTVTRSDVLIAEIAFEATFYCNGNYAHVTAKEVTRTDTYDGWNYRQTSFTHSDSTVTLEFKLTKLLTSVPLTMTMTCDPDGNMTYT